jgi:hypothetical protein
MPVADGVMSPERESLDALGTSDREPLRLRPATAATEARSIARLQRWTGHAAGILAGVIAIVAAMLLGMVAKDHFPAAAPANLRAGIGVDLFHGAALRPEPAERLSFGLSLLLAPLALAGAYCVARRRIAADRAAAWSLGLSLLAATGLAAWFFSTAHERGILWPASHEFLVPAAVAALAVMVLLAFGRRCESRLRVRLADGAAVLVCAFLASHVIYAGSRDVYVSVHEEPLLFPLVQVLHGRTILVDCESLYGLYPHWLEPVFRVVPLSPASFSAVMASLLFVVLIALYRFLRITTGTLSIAWLGFAACFFSCFTHLNGPFPHFQCFPIRALFPALVLWLGARYVQRPIWGRLLALSVVAGLAPLWNLDSGLAALAAALAVVGSHGILLRVEPARTRFMRTGALLATMVALAALLAGAVLVLLMLRSGQWPDVARLGKFQRIFYEHGFLAENLPPLGAWWLLAVIYLGALQRGMAALTSRQGDRLAPVFVQLAALGSVLFAYYQGRSVVANFYFVAWPAVLILALWLPDLVRRMRSFALFQQSRALAIEQSIAAGQFAATSFALALLVATMAICNQQIGLDPPLLRLAQDTQEHHRAWEIRTHWVRESMRGELRDSEVLVLSARDHLWHMYLDRPSLLDSAGFNHLFYESEIDRVAELIADRQAACVVWDETYLASPIPEINYGFLSPQERTRLERLLHEHYETAGRFSVLGERPTTIYVLRREKEPIVARRSGEGSRLR